MEYPNPSRPIAKFYPQKKKKKSPILFVFTKSFSQFKKKKKLSDEKKTN